MSEELETGQSHSPTEECDGYCGSSEDLMQQLDLFVEYNKELGPLLNGLVRQVDLFAIEMEFRHRELHDAADLVAVLGEAQATGVRLHTNVQDERKRKREG